MKRYGQFIVLIASALSAQAQLIVHDPLKAAQDGLNHAMSFVQEVDTTVNTLDTKLNQIEHLTRYGDYRSWTSKIPLVGSLTRLAGTGMKLYQDVNGVRYSFSPQAVQGNLSSVLAAYQYPSWQGAISNLGVQTSPYAPNYQFSTSQYQAIAQLESLLAQIDQEEASLQQQRTQLMNYKSNNQADNDIAAKELMAVNGALADLASRKRDIQMRIQMLNQKAGYGQQVVRQVQSEQAMGLWQQSAEANQMPTNNYVTRGTEFGAVDNPATGGTGDPGTDGNWYTGNHGNYIGGTDSRGIALPAGIQSYWYGSTQAAQGQMVTITNMNTGVTTSAPIVDTSPANKGIDLLYGTARDVGMPVNGSDPIKISFPNAPSHAPSGST
jgi:hypothetical protein